MFSVPELLQFCEIEVTAIANGEAITVNLDNNSKGLGQYLAHIACSQSILAISAIIIILGVLNKLVGSYILSENFATNKSSVAL